MLRTFTDTMEHQMNQFRRNFSLVICVGLLCLCGCRQSNSNLGTVTGTVTIDGEPISHAIVSFKPTDGRSSIGLTDADGVYTLGYVRNQQGALIGNHKVVVQTDIAEKSELDEEAGDANSPGPRKEMLPKKYCDWAATELTATVESGANTIDFALESRKRKKKR